MKKHPSFSENLTALESIYESLIKGEFSEEEEEQNRVKLLNLISNLKAGALVFGEEETREFLEKLSVAKDALLKWNPVVEWFRDERELIDSLFELVVQGKSVLLKQQKAGVIPSEKPISYAEEAKVEKIPEIREKAARYNYEMETKPIEPVEEREVGIGKPVAPSLDLESYFLKLFRKEDENLLNLSQSFILHKPLMVTQDYEKGEILEATPTQAVEKIEKIRYEEKIEKEEEEIELRAPEAELKAPEAELKAPEAEWEEDIDFIIPLSEDQLYSKILQLEASRYSIKKELDELKVALKNQKITVENFENIASVLQKDLDLIEKELKRLQNIIKSVSK